MSWEDVTEVGGGSSRLGKVLLRGDTCIVVVWGRDLGVVGANGAESGGISYWFSNTGDEVEVKKDKRRLVEEGGGGLSASGSMDTTAPRQSTVTELVVLRTIF